MHRADLAPQLEFASLFLAFVGHACAEIWRGAGANLNHFGGPAAAHVEDQDSELRSHADADMTYHGGLFRLAEGEALEVTVRPPDRPFTYWGLTVTNPWMESYDGRYATTSLNDRTARRERGRVLDAGDRPGTRAGPTGSTPAAGGGLHAGALGAGRRPAPPHRPALPGHRLHRQPTPAARARRSAPRPMLVPVP